MIAAVIVCMKKGRKEKGRDEAVHEQCHNPAWAYSSLFLLRQFGEAIRQREHDVGRDGVVPCLSDALRVEYAARVRELLKEEVVRLHADCPGTRAGAGF